MKIVLHVMGTCANHRRQPEAMGSNPIPIVDVLYSGDKVTVAPVKRHSEFASCQRCELFLQQRAAAPSRRGQCPAHGENAYRPFLVRASPVLLDGPWSPSGTSASESTVLVAASSRRLVPYVRPVAQCADYFRLGYRSPKPAFAARCQPLIVSEANHAAAASLRH
jgi:hypothetical protein